MSVLFGRSSPGCALWALHLAAASKKILDEGNVKIVLVTAHCFLTYQNPSGIGAAWDAEESELVWHRTTSPVASFFLKFGGNDCFGLW